ncbi:uncharacterized protein LOC135200245 isoform X3 [Macrobrachium nipponense]
MDRITKAIKNNEELINKLKCSKEKLRNKILSVLKEIEDSNSKHIAYLTHENESLKRQLDALVRQERQVQDIDLKLENSEDFTTCGRFIDEAKEINATCTIFMEDLTEFLYKNKRSRHSIGKAVEKLKRDLVSIEEILNSRALEENEEINLSPGMVAMAGEEDVPEILTRQTCGSS